MVQNNFEFPKKACFQSLLEILPIRSERSSIFFQSFVLQKNRDAEQTFQEKSREWIFLSFQSLAFLKIFFAKTLLKTSENHIFINLQKTFFAG